MDSSFRIGIDPHWERKWQTIRKTNLAAVRSRLANELIPALEHYACTGEGKRPIVDGVQVAEVKPNHGDVVMKWEHYVYSDLIGYAFARQLEFEVQAVDEGRCDEALAMHAFASAYISQLIELHIHNRFPLRFGGRRRAGMYPAALPFTVLGLLMGATQAVDLARMQLAAYRRGTTSILVRIRSTSSRWGCSATRWQNIRLTPMIHRASASRCCSSCCTVGAVPTRMS